MQFGHRTQNTSTHKSLRQRTPPLHAVGFDGDALATTPTSASWQAAEAAFAAPQFLPPPPHQALITVRRTRGAVLAESDASAGSSPSPEMTQKGPRVFRVDAVQMQHGSGAAAPGSAAAHLAQPDASPPSHGPASKALPRSRRIPADRAPGAVLHIVHKLPARPERENCESPALQAAAQTVTLTAALTAALAQVGPVLEAIQRAQSFCFIDEGSAQAWQALSQQTDALRQEIQAQWG